MRLSGVIEYCGYEWVFSVHMGGVVEAWELDRMELANLKNVTICKTKCTRNERRNENFLPCAFTTSFSATGWSYIWIFLYMPAGILRRPKQQVIQQQTNAWQWKRQWEERPYMNTLDKSWRSRSKPQQVTKYNKRWCNLVLSLDPHLVSIRSFCFSRCLGGIDEKCQRSYSAKRLTILKPS